MDHLDQVLYNQVVSQLMSMFPALQSPDERSAKKVNTMVFEDDEEEGVEDKNREDPSVGADGLDQQESEDLADELLRIQGEAARHSSQAPAT